MASETVQRERWEEGFWKEFSSVADYFAPAIAPLQKHFGVGAKELMLSIGVLVGKKAAAQLPDASAAQMLDHFSEIWSAYNLGHLQVTSVSPLTLLVTDCRICGQLPGTGEMYECAFHEGFFQGALSAKLGRDVSFNQETNYEGTAGTWCRRLVADVQL